MNTLREIGEFVGLGRATPPHPGQPIRAQITMRSVGNKVPVLNIIERTSMRAMILGLQKLPPISLEAEAEDTVGEVPLLPVLHIHPSNGVILETNFDLLRNGQRLLSESRQGNGPDSFSFFTVDDPGFFVYEVTRVGIPNTGITTLKKTFDIIARAKPEPPPPPPPSPPPTISATTEGTGAGTILVVTGSGFLRNKTVTVRVVDDVFHERNFQQSSTTAGELKMRISLPCNSGLPFHVSATDSRPAPGILGVLFSNNVTLPCP
jgi:hypothetical protein